MIHSLVANSLSRSLTRTDRLCPRAYTRTTLSRPSTSTSLPSYGDVHVETERGKVFSICFIFIATVVIAQVVSLPTDIYLSRMRRSAMKKVLNTKMDRVMFERMDKVRRTLKSQIFT